jgi:hypothetical protein
LEHLVARHTFIRFTVFQLNVRLVRIFVNLLPSLLLVLGGRSHPSFFSLFGLGHGGRVRSSLSFRSS